ncbi:MAG TPA: ABC transporter permease, partial [Anaerolineales bacterium]
PMRSPSRLGALALLSLFAVAVGCDLEKNAAYMDNSGADIFVSQSGVENMHMAASSLPAIDIEKVEGVSGVQSVTPIHYTTNMIVIGADRNLAYIIGLPENAVMGAPWKISTGSSRPAPGEAVIDRNVAEKTGVRVGSEVEILGRKFKVAGLSEGTASLINSVAFISMSDFTAVQGNPETVSYLLVKVKPGESPKDVVERIKAQSGDMTVQLTSEFAARERKVVKDMSTDVINIMNLIGFFIGLAVMALTIYTATLARRAEYGVLKAIGARNGHLYQAVLAQALFSVVIGFGVGVAFTWLLSALIPRLGLNLTLIISDASLLKVGAVSLIIASFSALLPIRQIAGLDPAMVFRGK